MASEAEIEKAKLDEWRKRNPFAGRAIHLVDENPEDWEHSNDAHILALAVLALAYELNTGTLQITF